MKAGVLCLLSVLYLKECWCGTDVPVVCGGFVKSDFQADFAKVKVNLYSIDGTLKYSTDCAPTNGYFLLPLYDQGEYLVKTVPPQGWMITPNEVPLVVKGSIDPCSSGKDILFELVGFTLEGQVTSGDHLNGPEGVEISMLPAENGSADSNIRHTYTVTEGRFKVEGVSPGNYQLQASHPVWKVSQESVYVVIVDAPVVAPSGLKVLGYDVKGVVRSGGEPVGGVLFFLFSGLSKGQVVCSSSVATPPASPRPEEEAACVVSSDSAGRFILYPLPPGTYSLMPVYQREKLQFEVHPVEFQFTVSNDSMILPHHFEVQGFSVTGQILLTQGGSPVSGAHVMLGEDHVTTTDEQGQYQLLNVTTGTYSLKIEAPNMQFDTREVHISPSSPSLPPTSPNKYLVSGDVIESVPTSTTGKMKLRDIQVLTSGSNPQVLATTTTTAKGEFSLYLPLGEYNVKVVIPPEEAERGLLILPEEQFVAMIDTPVTSRIIFTQFLANLSGSVKCIENCPEGLNIKLTRSHEGKQELSAKVGVNGNKGLFSFSNVLPGAIKVLLEYPSWCWKSAEVSTVIVKGSQSPLKFVHTGYSMSYEVSHDTLIKYYRGNDTGEEAVLTGKSSLCLKQPGLYHITPKSCHKFERTSYNFDTSSPTHLRLLSHGHTLHIPVHTEVEDASLHLLTKTSIGEEVLRPEKVEEVSKGRWVYSFAKLVKSSEKLELQPQSSLLMFSPPSLVWTVGTDCPEAVTPFQGSPGELVEGRVEPSLPNVTVLLDLGGDGQITTYTDDTGYYRAGPVRGGDHISISVALDGYVFESLDNSRSFRGIKLCHVAIQVSNIHAAPLAGVLVSISGESYRQNSFTDDNGVLTYSQLVPGQYFVKPFLREFDFTPSSVIVNLKEGQTESMIFSGRRVAFSCSGTVSTLNHRPLSAITVQATGKGSGEQCSSYSETATTDSEGAYRLHGLMPGCEYNVSVRQGDSFHTLPSYKALTVAESDIERMDFLLMAVTNSVYISGWVQTDSKFVGTLKAEIFVEGKPEESPLYAVAVDAVGFFDFPPLSPLAKGNYLLGLESSLSNHFYKYSSVEHVVPGDADSHVILQFTAEEMFLEKESQSRGSVIALILVIAIAFALVNFDKVLVRIRSYASSIPSSDADSRQRKPVQRKK